MSSPKRAANADQQECCRYPSHLVIQRRRFGRGAAAPSACIAWLGILIACFMLCVLKIRHYRPPQTLRQPRNPTFPPTQNKICLCGSRGNDLVCRKDVEVQLDMKVAVDRWRACQQWCLIYARIQLKRSDPRHSSWKVGRKRGPAIVRPEPHINMSKIPGRWIHQSQRRLSLNSNHHTFDTIRGAKTNVERQGAGRGLRLGLGLGRMLNFGIGWRGWGCL